MRPCPFKGSSSEEDGGDEREEGPALGGAPNGKPSLLSSGLGGGGGGGWGGGGGGGGGGDSDDDDEPGISWNVVLEDGSLVESEAGSGFGGGAMSRQMLMTADFQVRSDALAQPLAP